MNDKHQRNELYIEGEEERDRVVRRGSMEEMVLSKLFKHEENLAKGIGLSSLEEQLKHRQGSGKHARHARYNEWALSAGTEVWGGVLEFFRSCEQKCLWFVYDSHLHPYPRGNGAFSGLGAGTVCLGTILYFLTSPEIPGSSLAITQIRAITPWA